MKKLILLLLMMFTITSFSQTQYRKIYTSTYTEETGMKSVTNTFLYNYGNTTDLKIYYTNGESEIFEQVTEYIHGKTISGYGYISCMYHGRNSDIRILLQIFDDVNYGIRITFQSGQSIQFYE